MAECSDEVLNGKTRDTNSKWVWPVASRVDV